MIPYIKTPYGSINTFVIIIACGIISFFAILNFEMQKCTERKTEEIFIFPKIAYSMLIGYLFAVFADALFKLPKNGYFTLQGMTFYGGFLGGIAAMYFQLTLKSYDTQYSVAEWFNLLVLPLISFHFWGRIGCFFAGCCYGKPTKSFLGMDFPDNFSAGIFHYGERCLPTQLFEAVSLLIIFLIVRKCSKKFDTYIVLYAFARFIIEFFRGDNRGYFLYIFSPAQIISIILILFISVKYIKKK